MKKLVLIAAAAMCACAPKVTVSVENTLESDRSSQLVEIPVAQLASVKLAQGQTYAVMQSGKVVPSQVTHDGLLVFQSGLAGKGSTSFVVRAGKPQEFAAKAFARFAPERMDDFIWENDRVAFRIYGAALIATDGPSNGIDALFKRSEEMVLDKWYADNLGPEKLSYHDDHGTGLDDYKVGRTLGAGGMAPWADSVLLLNTNFTGHELLDAGPLRAAFRLSYPEGETREFRLDAGSQLTRVTQKYAAAPATVAAGYPLHADSVDFRPVGTSAMMVVEPATAKSENVFLGMILPTRSEVRAANGHALALAPYNPEGMVYYTGYGWQKWGEWSAKSWEQYLLDTEAALQSPFIVTVK